MGCSSSKQSSAGPKQPPGPPLDRSALLAEIFQECDADGNGTLSIAEFRRLAGSEALKGASLNMQEAIFSLYDEDGDSTLSLDEFIRANLESGSGLSDPEFFEQAQTWRKLVGK